MTVSVEMTDYLPTFDVGRLLRVYVRVCTFVSVCCVNFGGILVAWIHQLRSINEAPQSLQFDAFYIPFCLLDSCTATGTARAVLVAAALPHLGNTPRSAA